MEKPDVLPPLNADDMFLLITTNHLVTPIFPEQEAWQDPSLTSCNVFSVSEETAVVNSILPGVKTSVLNEVEDGKKSVDSALSC
jgi:hypothetical protein